MISAPSFFNADSPLPGEVMTGNFPGEFSRGFISGEILPRSDHYFISPPSALHRDVSRNTAIGNTATGIPLRISLELPLMKRNFLTLPKISKASVVTRAVWTLLSPCHLNRDESFA